MQFRHQQSPKPSTFHRLNYCPLINLTAFITGDSTIRRASRCSHLTRLRKKIHLFSSLGARPI
jgi:hypothetical protein